MQGVSFVIAVKYGTASFDGSNVCYRVKAIKNDLHIRHKN
jgi:hypothetical protein